MGDTGLRINSFEWSTIYISFLKTSLIGLDWRQIQTNWK